MARSINSKLNLTSTINTSIPHLKWNIFTSDKNFKKTYPQNERKNVWHSVIIAIYLPLFKMYFIYLRSSMNFSSRRTNLEQSHIWWCNKVIKIHDSYIFSEETSTMFYLPPSDNISSFPLFYLEVLTLVFPCAYRTIVIKWASISLRKYWDILSL